MGSLISYIYLESLDVESNIGQDTSKRGGGGAGTGTWQRSFISLVCISMEHWVGIYVHRCWWGEMRVEVT